MINNIDECLAGFTQNEQKLIELVKEYAGFSRESIDKIQELNEIIFQLNAKNIFLENENKNLRSKLDIINNSMIGKLGKKAYKLFKKIKNKTIGAMKK